MADVGQSNPSLKATAHRCRFTGSWWPLLIVVALILLQGFTASAPAQSLSEYRVKAAFLYQFLLFVEWPEEAFTDESGPIVIGILGRDPFGDAFADIEGKSIDGRRVEVRRFKRKTYGDELLECHLLFISTPDKEDMDLLGEWLRLAPVLMVSEHEGFLEQGGMINFVIRERRVRFAINDHSARSAGLQIRSRLKRLAISVTGEAGVNHEIR